MAGGAFTASAICMLPAPFFFSCCLVQLIGFLNEHLIKCCYLEVGSSSNMPASMAMPAQANDVDRQIWNPKIRMTVK